MAEILFVCYSLADVAGTSHTGVDFLGGLLETGHSVRVLTRQPWTNPPPFLSPGTSLPTWKVVPRGPDLEPRWSRDLPRRAWRWLRDVWCDRSNRKPDRSYRPDLVIVNDLGGHRLLESLDVGIARPRAFILQTQPVMYTGVYAHGSLGLERVMAELDTYDHIITVSRNIRPDWQGLGVLLRQPWTYIANCCREDALAPLRREGRSAVRARLGLPVDQFIMTCVARVDFGKAQDMLLDVMDEVLRIEPRAVVCMVGPVASHWGGDEVVRRVRKGGWGQRVLLTGSTPEALAYTAAADLFVLPSRGEAMPRSVLEAAALGTPILATTVAGIPEIIEHGREGLLFSPDDRAEFLRCFERAVGDRPEQAEFAERAARKYDEVFARRHQVERIRRFVAAALENPGRREVSS